MHAMIYGKPLPALPTETHAHILAYCDVQTLGRACSVSLAFLELASPHLYRDITITGFEQLQRLFYGEVRVSSAPHLDRFLSLDQTHTFTFVGVAADLPRAQRTLEEDSPSQLFFCTRSSCSFPVKVDRLDAYFINLRANPGGMEDTVASSITGSIMNLFDPVDVYLSSTSGGIDPLIIDLDRAPWTRLRLLSSDDVTAIGDVTESVWYPELKPSSLTLEFNLAMESETSEYLEYLLVNRLAVQSDEDEGPTELLATEWPQVKEVVIKMRCEDQKTHFRDWVRSEWEFGLELSAEERERREAMIRYVIQ